jgi:transposase
MALARLDCLGCQKRDRRIKQLQGENRQLRQRLDEVQREAKRQAHPFRRQDDKPSTVEQASGDEPQAARPGAAKVRKKKPGRRQGHKADLRPLPTADQVDRIIDVALNECPMCHVALYNQDQVVQYQTDLPRIKPIITRFNIETGTCPCCRQRWQGRHPDQTSNAVGAAGNTLGPNVLSMAAELKHRLGVSYDKICDYLQTYCQFQVCPSALIRAEQRLADLARLTYDALLHDLRRAQVVHADETGWRIGRVNAWLWVFSCQNATVYTIRDSRGADVPQDILGPAFDGYLVVDGLKSYESLHYAKASCNAHLLRRCKNLRDTVPASERAHINALSDLLKHAIDVADHREQLTPANYARRAQTIENELDEWLEANNRKHRPSAELLRLDQHVRRHRGEWLVFLHEAQVPPTNNHAEQMLRPAVITRKVGGCNKNARGARVHEILASIMVTCHRRGKRFLDLARQLWQSNTAQAVSVAKLPKAKAAYGRPPLPNTTILPFHHINLAQAPGTCFHRTTTR